jgi:hypothetical protein
MALGSKVLLETVPTIEVLRDVTAIEFVEDKSATWMILGELSHIKNKIIQDNEFPVALLHNTVKLLSLHLIEWLVIHHIRCSQIKAMRHLKERHNNGPSGDGHPVQDGINRMVLAVRVNAKEDGHLGEQDNEVATVLMESLILKDSLLVCLPEGE